MIQLELLLTAAMFAMALVTVVAGLFGMNLYNKAEDSYVAFILVRPAQNSQQSALDARLAAAAGYLLCSSVCTHPFGDGRVAADFAI